MKLTVLTIGFLMAVGCGKQAQTDESRLSHNDHKVIPVSTVNEVLALYQAAMQNGDLTELNHQVDAIQMLFRVPMDQLSKEIGLTPGFGQETVAFVPETGTAAAPLTADQAMANKLINQGIAMLHNFHYIDAVRSFQLAEKNNPDSAFAKIFLAISLIPFDGQVNGMVLAVRELVAAAQLKLTPQEAAWLDFARAYVFQMPPATLSATYRRLSDKLSPVADIEGRTLAGWLSGYGSGPAYSEVLVTNPNHIGANHYVTHLLEFRNDYVNAIPYAAKHASIATKNGHAQHMHGHLLPMVGDLDGALAQFLKADIIHKEWAAANGYDPDYDWHFGHNNHLLGIVYLAQDNIPDATSVLARGCQADFRACEGLAKASVMVLDRKVLQSAIDSAKVLMPGDPKGVEQYFAKYGAEIDYLSGGAVTAAELSFLGQAYKDKVLEKIASMESIQPGTPAIKEMKDFVRVLFAGGGFDSWANGFPDASRLRIAAEKNKLTEIVDYIDAQLAAITKKP